MKSIKPKDDLTFEYYEVPVNTVIKYFMRGFQKNVTLHESFYDPAKGVFILHLIRKKAGKP